jgi:hypothetical protein
MKRLIVSLALIALSGALFAQLSLTPAQTGLALANQLVATSGTLGVTVSNPVLTCHPNANGLFTGVSNFGISNGVALGTGEIMTTGVAPGISYGLDGVPGDFASQTLSMAGDSVLSGIISGAQTYDACVLEFDLQPVGNFVEFEYVFGSEEYPEFNCSAFNDLFAFHISGPGYATPTNIALIPTTTVPVSINTINDGTGGSCSNYTNLYVVNNDTTNTMDGFTVPLIAHATVTPGQTYHLRMAIADAGDMILNSYVLLRANSLKSGNTPNSVGSVDEHSPVRIYPTVTERTLFIRTDGQESWSAEVFESSGRPVARYTLPQGVKQESIDLGQLPAGLYTVRMQGEKSGTIRVQRLVRL